MKRLVIILALIAVLASSIAASRKQFFVRRPEVVGGDLIINFITNLASTANVSSYTTETFTVSAPAALILAEVSTCNGVTPADILVRNTGTSNLTWWEVRGKSTANGSHGIFASQLPPGVSPFNMTVVWSNSVANAGAILIHIFEVLNANTTTLWGTNAFLQSTQNVQSTSSPRIQAFNANSTAGTILFVSGKILDNITSMIPESPWVTYFESTITANDTGQESWVRTNMPAGVTSFAYTNASGVGTDIVLVEITK